MLSALHSLWEMSQMVWVPVGVVLAWGLIFLIASSLTSAITATVKQAQEMHQIPCANCVFFTGDYRLKCPVRPKIALSEEAINCPDYRSH